MVVDIIDNLVDKLLATLKFNEDHDEGGKFAPTGSGISRSERAKKSYNPANKAKHAIATKQEQRVAKVVGGEQTDDNAPFDVITGQHAIEVKTIVSGKNAKITMHPDSLERKVGAAKKNGYVAHTVAVDSQSNTIYYKEGVGSFRLSSMEAVSESQLKAKFK